MPAQVKHLIAPSGGDYTSVAAWEAGEQRDLVAADEIALGEITGDWSGGADTAYVNVDNVNWTTDATRYIRIYTAPDARHPGRWDTSKYVLSVSSQWNGVVRVDANYVRIDGLQIENVWTDATTGNVVGINQNGHGDEHTNNIIRWGGGGTPDSASDAGIQYDGAAAGTHKARNNIIYDWYMGMYFDYGAAGTTFVLYDNTINDNVSTGIWIQDSVGDVTLYMKNNICNGNGAADYNETTFTTYVHSKNISEDATSPDGASYQNKTVTFVDEAGDDFHIAAADTSGALKGGDNLSADAQMAFTDDVDGHARSSGPWTIGADEYRSVEVIRTISETGGDYTSTAAFEAAEQRDLVNLGEVAVAKIDGAWAAADTGSAYFDSADWVTAEGNGIKVYTTDLARHKGRPGTATYRINPAAAGGIGIRTGVPWTEIYGIEILDWGGSGYSAPAIQVNNGVCNCRIGYNLIHDEVSGNGGAGIAFGSVGSFGMRVFNNIIYGCRDGISGDSWSTSLYQYVYANTIWDMAQYGIVSNNGYTVAKDNLVQSCGTACYNSSFAAASTNNLADDTTAPGSNPINNATVSFIDTDTYPTRNYIDLRIHGESVNARSAGADLTSDADLAVTDDINGKPRDPLHFDVGASQFVAVARERIIADSGGDYTTQAAFEAGEEADLVAEGVALVGKISGSFAAAEAATVTYGGSAWYTCRGNGIKVYTLDDGARHPGRWSDTAYRIVVTTGDGILIQSPVRHVWIDGQQIFVNHSSTPYNGVHNQINDTSDQPDGLVEVSNNIIKGDGTAGGKVGGYHAEWAYGSNVEHRVWKNIIYDFGNGAGYKESAIICRTGVFWLYRNTMDHCRYGIYDDGAGADITAKANIVLVYGTTPVCYQGTFNANSTNNLASDATAPGSNPINNATPVFVDQANDDYHLDVTDTDALGAGLDLSADAEIPITDDIDGHDLKITPDVGADEYRALEIVRTIAESAGAGDYTTLAGAEAGEERDLVHAGEVCVLKPTGSWAAAETAGVVFAGSWYTSTGNRLRIVTDKGDAARPDGVGWDTGAYRAEIATFGGTSLTVSVDHVDIDGIQVGHAGSWASRYGLYFTNASGYFTDLNVFNSIFRITGTDGSGSAAFLVNSDHLAAANSLRTKNCVVLESLNDGFNFGTGPTAGVTAYDLTARNCLGTGIYGYSNRVLLKNCLGDNCGVNDFNPGMAATGSDYNASSDATAPGTNSRINQTFSFANVGAGDYRLTTADTGARQRGTDLSADASLAVTDDFDGNTRVPPTDIGAFELLTKGTGGVGGMFNRGMV